MRTTTKATTFAKIRCFLRAAFRRGWIKEALVDKVTTVKAVYNQKEPYTDEEVRVILDHAQELVDGTHGYAKGTVYSAAVAALLVVVAITVSTFSVSPVGSTLHVAGVLRVVPPWIMDLACGVGSTVAGGTLVLFFSWVFRNSLAIRPTAAGALYGAGAGLAINAGWRSAWPYPTFRHTLGAHGAAIVATVLLGALIGRFLGARRFHSADGGLDRGITAQPHKA